ncbi:hypothetical protein [Paenibacillus sp. FSL H3-0286]|uniref:hypothetical protein n=1 Tax=Paenibacillus sp. FSL H3-0286 TaxID=2921427 RepID=UPI0032476C22
MEIVARARLRPVKDRDLIKAFEQLPEHEDKSDVVREALRLLFFGIKNERRSLSIEIPIYELETDEEFISDEEVNKSIDEFLQGI